MMHSQQKDARLFNFSWMALVFGLSVMVGCAGKPVDPNDPASLMEEVEATIKSDHFQLAIDKLRAIKNRFPYSKQAAEAQLRIGDVYFMQESFAEAAVSYETFRDLHPKHEKAGYALYRTSLSYFSDLPTTVARDFSLAEKVVAASEEYLTIFPQGEFLTEVTQLRTDTLNKLAAKEFYIAEFYEKRGYLDSATRRLKKLISSYPNTPAATDAKNRLASFSNRTSKNQNFIPLDEASTQTDVPSGSK